LKPDLPPHLEGNVIVWNDHEARFYFAEGCTEPPGPVGRWFWPLLPLLIASAACLVMSSHMSWPEFFLGLILFAAGMAASLSLLRLNKPWKRSYEEHWRDDFLRRHSVRFDFDRGEVYSGKGRLFGHFEDLELAIHVGQCFGGSMFTVLVPMNPYGSGWYLAVLDRSNIEQTFLGPGTLGEMEEVGRSLLRQYPFQRVRNYVATIRGKDGKEHPTTTYEVDR
jgi:hypothetical protein